MERRPKSPLAFKNNKLHFQNLNLEQAISSIPTPFYLYSQEQLEKNIISFKDHADELNHEFLICYALKANSNLRLLQILEKHNIGADIVSGGELEQALKAKIDNSKIIFSGVGKQDYEIEKALDSQVLSINIESIEELKSVNALARLKKRCAKIAFRYNPHVEVSTHKHISTGSNKHKFGMSRDDIMQALNDSELWSNCKLIGLSIHIGSQLMELSATAHAVSKLSKLADEIGIQLDFLDVGGGLGVDYDQNNSAPSIKDYMQTVQTHLVSSNFKRIIFEPGRRIMADAGVFISRVIRTKTTAGHNFLIVDGGMNDFARPSLYGAGHAIYPSRQATEVKRFDVVGPVCESADCFARGLELPELNAGDFIAIADTGAYGRSMSSTYNLRALPKEILLTKKGELLDITPP